MWQMTWGEVVKVAPIVWKPVLVFFVSNLLISALYYWYSHMAAPLFEAWTKVPLESRRPIVDILIESSFYIWMPAWAGKTLLWFFAVYYAGVLFLKRDGLFEVASLNLRTYARFILKFLQTLLVVLIVCLVLEMLFNLIVVSAFKVPSTMPIVASGYGLLAFAGATFVSIRFFLVGPLAFLRAREVLHDSWDLTDGNFWSILGNLLVLLFPVALIEVWLRKLTAESRIDPNMAFAADIFLRGVGDVLSILLLTAFMAKLLRRTYEGRKAAKPSFQLTLPTAR
jgi:hypothetical protein